MTNPELHKIVALDFTKRWAGAFSLLCTSYFGEQYINICKAVLGEGFKNILFTHKNGATTCYRVKSETTVFGDHLVQLALQEPAILNRWANDLKIHADAVRAIIKNPPKAFLDVKKYCEFETAFENYGPAQFAITTAPNFLPPKLLEIYLPAIEEARRYSEAVYNETEEFFRKLCDNIGQKENIDSQLIASMYKEEMKDYLATGVLPATATLRDRFSLSGIYFSNSTRTALNREDSVILEKLIAEKNGLTPGFVKGTSASPGIARGTVRIVPDPRHVKIFNEGDILITGMTRPDFVPLMKKAGAIVTDAGGLLCHAAIVSRELGKPCVIATEVATQAFKDGDTVEVNAITGVVRLI